MAGLIAFLALVVVVLVLGLTLALLHDITHPRRRSAAWAVARGLPVDPGEAGFEFSEWMLEVAARRGRRHRRPVRLPVWDIPVGAVPPDGRAEETTPSGRGGHSTVLVIHDRDESRTIALSRAAPAWRPLTPRRVVLYDRRGHGDAEGSGARPGSRDVEDLILLIIRVCGEVAPLQDDPGLTLIGFGEGGAIAHAAAADARIAARVDDVVAIDPWPSTHEWIACHIAALALPRVPFAALVRLGLRFLGTR